MSTLGHKRTSRSVWPRFVAPRKQTSLGHCSISAKCQKRTSRNLLIERHNFRIELKRACTHLAAFPSHSNVRANQFPRSVSRAEPLRCFVVTVSIPSRARSAVVTPDIGLLPGAPCQAPSFLWSSPELKQVTKAFRFAGDRKAIGARCSPGASTDKGPGEIVSVIEVF